MASLVKICTASLFLLMFVSAIFAETIYLRNGESLQGTIIKVDSDYIYLESKLGYGTVKIPRGEVIMAAFPGAERIDLTSRYGIGYLDKNLGGGANGKYLYSVNQASFRTYLNNYLFFDFLVGYTGYTYQAPGSKVKEKYSVFEGDVRGAYVFYRRASTVAYVGVGAGSFSVEDTSNNFKQSGIEAQVFVGAELFFQAIPDFGFSGELSLNNQTSSNLSRNDIGVVALPVLAVHYYF